MGSAELLPAPKRVVRGRDALRHIGAIRAPKDLAPLVAAFRADFPAQQQTTAPSLEVSIDPKLADERYVLTLGEQPTLIAGGAAGVAWGLQSLGQVLATGARIDRVEDSPDFGFRAVMIDVARRYHSPSTLRRIVRWCQLGKVRYLQLHLTDDQNWMMPTDVLKGVDSRNTHKRPTYTKQELTELQAYASARGVTLIPEIDLPGHSTLLCQYDPELFRIQGSPSTNCINFASPLVRAKLAQLIHEVADVFPNAPYIHLGGDEAWYPTPEKDPHFAAQAGKSAQQVFVDFVAELSRVVMQRRRTPIVWEGFGRSDYAKATIPRETVVIAWENHYYPADELLADGYRIVNAGWNPGYVVNHYPWDAYTLVPLPKMYQWDPRVFGLVVDDTTHNLGDSPNLLGGLMCWWEGHEWNAQRVLPHRIATFGARLWNRNGERDFSAFQKRLDSALARIDRESFPYRLRIEGAARDTEFEESITLSAASDRRTVVAFRTDGQIPGLKDTLAEIKLQQSAVVTIQAYREGQPIGETQFVPVQRVKVVKNLALAKPVTTTAAIDPDFPPARLTDGVSDVVGSYWLGYPNPVSATIDLGEPTEFNRVDVVAFYAAGQATRYRISVSLDGKEWTTLADASAQNQGAPAEGYLHTFEKQSARYVRLECVSSAQHPATMSRIHEVRVFFDAE
jgi:hexosaminidase